MREQFYIFWPQMLLYFISFFIYKILTLHCVGKVVREARVYQNGWISGKFPKGGGVISDPKNFIAIFFALEKAILVMNFRKKLRKGGGHFRSEKFHCKFSAGATGLRKKSQYFFPKKGRGQRPFGNFPKIHPFWQRQASLSLSVNADSFTYGRLNLTLGSPPQDLR